jgi:hypothetical protein
MIAIDNIGCGCSNVTQLSASSVTQGHLDYGDLEQLSICYVWIHLRAAFYVRCSSEANIAISDFHGFTHR